MTFYCCLESALPFSPHTTQTRLTLRDINHRLEHQRHQNDEHQIVDEELRCMPVWRRSAAGNGTRAGIFARSRSRVGSSFERSGGRCGESSIQGIEGVDSSEPGGKGSHLSTSIAHAHTPLRKVVVKTDGEGRSAARSSRGGEPNRPISAVRIGIIRVGCKCYYYGWAGLLVMFVIYLELQLNICSIVIQRGYMVVHSGVVIGCGT